MTDRELLELAAKAAGIRIDKSETNGGGVGNDGFSVTGDAMLDWHNNIRWNPLTDDGDALRLAVKLYIPFHVFYEHKSVIAYSKKTNLHTEGFDAQEFFTEVDEFTATRRAIVRAAAEIGKAMGGGQHGTE